MGRPLRKCNSREGDCSTYPNRSGSPTVSDAEGGPFRWHPITPDGEDNFLSSRPNHVPTVPISVKAPVTPSMLYIETLFEPEFVT